jgi:hypothetical protein
MIANKQKISRRQILQALAMLLFLVALPLGSWYYLSTGLNYRREILGDLSDHGRIPAFVLSTDTEDTLRREDLEGKLVVASFFGMAGDSLPHIYGAHLEKLHDQFDDRDDIVFLQHVVVGDTSSFEQARSFAVNYGLYDPGQSYFLFDEPAAVERLAREGYRLPAENGAALAQNPYIALADTALTIRRYYDVRRLEDVQRLVEHIALLLPREKEEDPVLKREKER